KKSLNLWSSLAAAFMAGFGAGAAFVFFRSKAKLSLYQRFIEDRLSRLNTTRYRVQAGRAH
ncbi:MAG: hypothetical protein WB819_20605, partial [Terriglobia bacterium]